MPQAVSSPYDDSWGSGKSGALSSGPPSVHGDMQPHRRWGPEMCMILRAHVAQVCHVYQH